MRDIRHTSLHDSCKKGFALIFNQEFLSAQELSGTFDIAGGEGVWMGACLLWR